MSSVRQLRTGKWEATLRHPELPKGRKYFTFDTEVDARNYARQWDLLVKAGKPPPAVLMEKPKNEATLGVVLRAKANADETAPSDQDTIRLLIAEVGTVKFSAVTYAWAENWVRDLKVKQNLAPSSIRKRVGTLSRAIDSYLRRMPDIALSNPLSLLPKRYSTYSDRDVVLGAMPKTDASRERRLLPGEEERIAAAMRGEKRPDRERALSADPALLALFQTLLLTGLRLKEAYTLRVEQIDFDTKVIRARKSKLWGGKVAYKDVPIQPGLFPILKAQATTGLVFPFWDGIEPERKATNRLSAAFARAFAYAQCEGLTEHDLRHEATCRWFELKGKDGHWMFRSEEIHRIMGWSANSKMALRYASFRGEALAQRLWA